VFSYKVEGMDVFFLFQKEGEKKYEPAFFQYFIELDVTQHLSNSDLEFIQDIKFRKLMKYVWEYIPFYRNIMEKNGLIPDDFARVNDVQKLPYLTKDIVRKYGDRMLSDRYMRNWSTFKPVEPLVKQ